MNDKITGILGISLLIGVLILIALPVWHSLDFLNFGGFIAGDGMARLVHRMRIK